MRLTGFELIDHGGPEAMKGWLTAMNMEAKKEALVFPLNGPCTLPARARKTSQNTTGPLGGPSIGTQWQFAGHEQLCLQSVFADHDIKSNTVLLKATFVPAPTALRLLSDGLVNMTMDLDKAMDTFAGLEDWVGRMTELGAKVMKASKTQTFRAAPKVDEFRESEEWGAW